MIELGNIRDYYSPELIELAKHAYDHPVLNTISRIPKDCSAPARYKDVACLEYGGCHNCIYCFS